MPTAAQANIPRWLAGELVLYTWTPHSTPVPDKWAARGWIEIGTLGVAGYERKKVVLYPGSSGTMMLPITYHGEKPYVAMSVEDISFGTAGSDWPTVHGIGFHRGFFLERNSPDLFAVIDEAGAPPDWQEVGRISIGDRNWRSAWIPQEWPFK